jgi:FAD:protein FMN transferase
MHSRMRPLLGTFVEIHIANAGQLDTDQCHRILSGAFAVIEQIHHLLSFHSPESDLSRLNLAQQQWISLHPLSIHCLKLARALTRISDGKFNCTLGKAIVDAGALPSPLLTNKSTNNNTNSRTDWLAIGDWNDIEIQHQQARLRRPVLITLDGIAKGFAVDCAIKYLQQQGILSAWINAGGDVRIYGDAIIPISICDHRGQLHAMGGLHNAALATSTSHYSTEHPGLLLDPHANPIAPMTFSVIAHSAWRADALTKVAANVSANVPEHERRAYLHKFGGNWIALNEH